MSLKGRHAALCLLSLAVWCDYVEGSASSCKVRARIDTGRMCGTIRAADNGQEYASFLGVPYATQPLGELRFQELRPAKPWYHLLDATKEGPICPQHDEVFPGLTAPHQGMSEACIYANIHVPFNHFINQGLPLLSHEKNVSRPGLPILVYVHGGAFQAGSGDTDLNGPEYLVGQDVIMMTFNHRINVFGFLYLNTPKVPGNQGLRDILTFLRWVQRNAKVFGGDPDNVTLMGQSAGATCAHLVALSKASKGLFKRVILLSGSAVPSFYTASPLYSKLIATLFLTKLGINSTDLDFVHDQLVKIPLERILQANDIVQFLSVLISFNPVVETPFPGITTVVDDEPIELIKRGRDREYPIMLGFTSDECEYFRPRLQYKDFLESRLPANRLQILNPRIVFSTPPPVSLQLAEEVIDRYFHGNFTYDELMPACTDTFFLYPAFKLAQWRTEIRAAPTYLYQFSYESQFSRVKEGLMLKYRGAAHVDDLTYVFRTNTLLHEGKQLPHRDEMMKNWMRDFVTHFMRCSDPTCFHYEKYGHSSWPPFHEHTLNYQWIDAPGKYRNRGPTEDERDTIDFFDMIEARSRNATLVDGILSEETLDLIGLVANMTSQLDGTGRLTYVVRYKPKKEH